MHEGQQHAFLVKWSMSLNASMTKKSNYFPHDIRLSVWSNQMSMQKEAAMPEILSRSDTVATHMLPT